jgi:hypothetical protein
MRILTVRQNRASDLGRIQALVNELSSLNPLLIRRFFAGMELNEIRWKIDWFEKLGRHPFNTVV